MIPLLSTVFLTGFVGSPHCLGMCGGFAAFAAYSDAHRRSGSPSSGGGGPSASSGLYRFGAILAYHGGRLFTYLSLGALAGAVGAGLDVAGRAAGVAHVPAIIAAVLLILWGSAQLIQRLGVKKVPQWPHWTPPGLAAALRVVSGTPPVPRGFVVGALTTLLPCGFLYAYLTVAAGTGAAWSGMAVMGTFWLATVPALTVLGGAVRWALGPASKHLPVATAVMIVVAGLFSLYTHLRVPMASHGQHAAADMTTHESSAESHLPPMEKTDVGKGGEKKNHEPHPALGMGENGPTERASVVEIPKPHCH